MFKQILSAAVISLLAAGHASARDDVLSFSVEAAMNTPDAQAKLDDSITFHFGDTGTPAFADSFGRFQSNKKTNAFNKSDERACQHAFLSAMLSFQNRVRSSGADAVVNIRSNYKSNETSSTTEFKCGAGAFVAGVTLTGEVVKLR